MSDDHLTLRIEAVLMTADRPLGERKLALILQLDGAALGAAADEPDAAATSETDDTEPADGEAVVADRSDAAPDSPVARIRTAVESLNADYEKTGRSFRIERVAGGLQMLTMPAYAEDITRLKGARQSSKLSQAALETLAIIAYRQPILRADLESIRGVACGEVLRSLMERRLVRIAGRAEEVGRPMLYGTTKEFLEIFGLATLDDLPNAKDLRPAPPKPDKKRDAKVEKAETMQETSPANDASASDHDSAEVSVEGVVQSDMDQSDGDQPAASEAAETANDGS
jgi:segregation and condensation protein B